MGQHLTIGIATICNIPKDKLQKNKISLKELIEKMQEKFHFEPSIYDVSTTPESYVFKLKPTILQSQLLSFLQKLYPILYAGRFIDYGATLELLETSSPTTWLTWLENEGFEEFQLDRYGTSDYLQFDRPFKPTIRLYFSNIIMLSIEGKISMEVYGRQFRFFKYCLQETFVEFSLAKAIKIYIAG